jgi:ABC-2 type transport system permease protein
VVDPVGPADQIGAETRAGPRADPPAGVRDGQPTRRQAYRSVLGARMRAQTTYRASFGFQVLANVAQGGLDFAEVYVVFHNVHVLGGLEFRAALLLFGLSNLAFALADVLTGSLDDIPRLIRSGTLEVLMLRPLSLLGQIVTADLALRRLGRAATAAAVLGVALGLAPIRWTPSHAVLLAVTPLAGAGTFAAVFVVAGAVQFWLVDGAEVTNGFTYGGSYAASFSAAVLPLPLRVFFAFVVPTAFVGYLPTLVLLGLPGPALLPSWLGWCGPAVAVLALGLAGLAWRSGIRHYTGAGG